MPTRVVLSEPYIKSLRDELKEVKSKASKAEREAKSSRKEVEKVIKENEKLRKKIEALTELVKAHEQVHATLKEVFNATKAPPAMKNGDASPRKPRAKNSPASD